MTITMEERRLEMGVPLGGPYPILGKLEKPRSATVRVPLCLDLGTIDSTEKFSMSPGGGGIGMAIDMSIFLRITPSDSWDIEVEPDHPLEHVCRSICTHLGHAGAFKVTTPDETSVPFDCTPELVAAAAAGVNAALGRPIGQRELRRIISHNLTDEVDGVLKLRPDTGVRVAGAFFGGLVIVTDELEIACRTPLSDSSSIVLVYPGEEEGNLDIGKMVQIDEKDREKKALEVLMKLIPAAIKSEYGKMGDSIYRLQLLGSKVVEIRRFGGGKDIYRIMSMLRVKGAEIVGVHGDTGVIAAYMRKEDLDECLDVVQDSGKEKILTRPDNKGMKITLTK
jgi:predicted sugar kinase